MREEVRGETCSKREDSCAVGTHTKRAGKCAAARCTGSEGESMTGPYTEHVGRLASRPYTEWTGCRAAGKCAIRDGRVTTGPCIDQREGARLVRTQTP